MKAISALILLFAAVGAGCPAGWAADAQEPPDLPVYKCPLIDKEIKLTGKLDDPLWQQAPAVSLMLADTGKKPVLATEVRLLCSKTTLYVGFHCADNYVVAQLTKRDDPVYNEDCVEVFVCPSGMTHQYFEIDVNPLSAVFDACVLNAWQMSKAQRQIKGIETYNIGKLRTAAYVEGEVGKPGGAKFWNVEYAIPLREMIGAPNTPPQPGDKWRLNLYRMDYPEKNRTEECGWSRTETTDFHRAWLFGTLEFVK